MNRDFHAPPEVRLSIDDAAVLLGVLRLVEPSVPHEVRALSNRVVVRVERGLKTAHERKGAAASSRTTTEAEARRLSELVHNHITELETLVSLLESVATRTDVLPLIMTTRSRDSLHRLASRLAKLVPAEGGGTP